MPYRARGNEVQVKRGDRWVLLKRHRSAKAARDHARALNLNVRHRGS